VRIGLVENTQRLRQAIRNIRSFLHADSNVAPAPGLLETDTVLETAK
jgi:hypothetical protein